MVASAGNPADPNGIQAGDILVGLHVWPTTSLKDVAEVLRRDDLAELNPLKFYAIRRLAINDSTVLPPDTHVTRLANGVKCYDYLLTGRIPMVTENRSTARADLRPKRKAGAPLNDFYRPDAKLSQWDPQPVQVEFQPQLANDEMIDEALKSDPNLVILNQELANAQYNLSSQQTAMKGGRSKEVDRLQKQVSAIQKQISDYRHQLVRQMQQWESRANLVPDPPKPIMPPPANPSAPIPTAQAPKIRWPRERPLKLPRRRHPLRQ